MNKTYKHKYDLGDMVWIKLRGATKMNIEIREIIVPSYADKELDEEQVIYRGYGGFIFTAKEVIEDDN